MRTADAQADLSLRWAHTHFVDFVMSELRMKQLLMKHLPECYFPSSEKKRPETNAMNLAFLIMTLPYSLLLSFFSICLFFVFF